MQRSVVAKPEAAASCSSGRQRVRHEIVSWGHPGSAGRRRRSAFQPGTGAGAKLGIEGRVAVAAAIIIIDDVFKLTRAGFIRPANVALMGGRDHMTYNVIIVG